MYVRFFRNDAPLWILIVFVFTQSLRRVSIFFFFSFVTLQYRFGKKIVFLIKIDFFFFYQIIVVTLYWINSLISFYISAFLFVRLFVWLNVSSCVNCFAPMDNLHPHCFIIVTVEPKCIYKNLVPVMNSSIFCTVYAHDEYEMNKYIWINMIW